MKVATCLIARLENKYIREYLEYYKHLGYDKIFIYDNNRPGEERILDEVEDFITSGFAEVIEWPDFTKMSQRRAYQDCWDKHRDEYDWISFFDSDEYLVLDKFNDIKDFLNQKCFEKTEGIVVAATIYDDNGIIVNDSKTRLDKYTRPSKKKTQSIYKSIVRCSSPNVNFTDLKIRDTQHIPFSKPMTLKETDGSDYRIFLTFATNCINFNEPKPIFLKHIQTGSIDDYINFRCKRRRIWNNDIDFGLDFFESINDLTQEKIDYYNKHIKMKVNKVATCLIARLENKYIREYVEYYQNLGYDKIFIYDNNRPGEEKIIDEIGDFVESGFAEVIDWPDFTKMAQRRAYQDCWDNHRDEYDWISFFDSDEYLVLNTTPDIKEFLSNEIYDSYYLITVMNVYYDDNDIIVNDSKTRLDKYTRPGKQANGFIKSIIRCKDNEVDFVNKVCSYHIPKLVNHADSICNVDGRTDGRTDIMFFRKEENAFLKHIPTGCIDDFIRYKNVRKHINGDEPLDLGYFKAYNELTQEKLDYYMEYRKNKTK